MENWRWNKREQTANTNTEWKLRFRYLWAKFPLCRQWADCHKNHKQTISTTLVLLPRINAGDNILCAALCFGIWFPFLSVYGISFGFIFSEIVAREAERYVSGTNPNPLMNYVLGRQRIRIRIRIHRSPDRAHRSVCYISFDWAAPLPAIMRH